MNNTVPRSDEHAFSAQKNACSKMIILDYYDGPVSGVAECEQDGQAYCFDMLDWDDQQDVRIFSLAPLASESFNRVVHLCSRQEEPRWPLWVPTRPEDFPASEAEKFWFAIAETLKDAGPPEWIVAWRDFGEGFLSIRNITQEDKLTLDGWFARLEPSRDWFAFLGLKK